MTESKQTRQHAEIRRWAEARDGHPSRVAEQAGNGGLLRIDFGKPEERLERISWDEFFGIFDDNELTFLYQEKTKDGEQSRFSKFIDRDSAEESSSSASSGSGA